ncbi:hypothetical protein ACX40Y_00870 [Sphingomonas sp. RS6]
MLNALVVAAFALQSGVAIDNSAQFGAATNHARCIVRVIGVAPADAGARAAKIDAAIKQCRDFIDSDFEAGRLLLNGRPYQPSAWRKLVPVLDAVQADIKAHVTAPKQYKIMWKLPDGSLVDAYDVGTPPKTLSLVTVAI